MKTKMLPQTEMLDEVRNWLYDNIFFEAEINFLKRMIEDQFIPWAEIKDIHVIQLIDKELSFLEMQRKDLKEDILAHKKCLKKTDCHSYINSEREGNRITHAKLEMAINNFLETLQRIKYELFIMTEQLRLKSEVYEGSGEPREIPAPKVTPEIQIPDFPENPSVKERPTPSPSEPRPAVIPPEILPPDKDKKAFSYPN